jgi:transposase-like protein
MKRRILSKDFKRKAVARYLNGEAPSSITKDLKISSSMLYKWMTDTKKDDAVTPKKSPTNGATAVVLIQVTSEGVSLEKVEFPNWLWKKLEGRV